MELTKTAKVQIYVSDDNKTLLLDSMRAYCNACNFISDYIYACEDLSQISVQKQTYNACRNVYGLPSQMACNAVRTVIGSYKTNMTNGYEWNRCRYNKPQMTLSWNRDYSINGDRFSIGTLNGRIKADYAKEGMEEYFDKTRYRFGSAKIVYKHSRFFLHISVTYNVKGVSESEICNVVGIDRGINFVVATYNSKHKSEFVSGKTVKQKRAHYSKLRKELQMRQTSSARRRLKAIGQREDRWMQDVNHQVSKALIDNNPKHTLFVLEDLTGIRSAAERVRVEDRYVSVSWSFYDLEQKLKYKASDNECLVINVDPKYTSQTCPCCGHIDKKSRRKKIHTFVCTKCGYTSNDDRIGAMNLYRMGIEYLVESQESTSSLSGAESTVPDVTSACV